MADKKICDYGTVTTLNSSDLFLVATPTDTYNITYDSLRRNVEGSTPKVYAYQGVENSGKILAVGSNGMVTLDDAPNIQPLSVSGNGVYIMPRTVDGFGPVYVNVGSGSGNADALIERTINNIDTSTARLIGDYAFYNCTSLVSVNFGAASYIGNHAFDGCTALEYMQFGASTMSIGESAFEGCVPVNLRIDADCDFRDFTANGLNVDNVKRFELNGVSEIGFDFPSFPSIEYFGASLCNRIGYYDVFWGSEIKEVSLPNVIVIGSNTFVGTHLEYADFPNCTDIAASYTFMSCAYLSYVNFPVLSYVFDFAFSGCIDLRSVSMPLCREVGRNAFDLCAFSEIDLPNCSLILGGAFNSCMFLERANFPKCEEIEYGGAFSCCFNLKSVYLLNSVMAVLYEDAASVFYSCSQNLSIYVPQSLVSTYRVDSNWSSFSSRITPYTG